MSDRSDWPRVLAERKKSSSSVSQSSRSSESRSKPKVPDEELDPIDAIARASGVQLTVDQSDSEDSLDELLCATTSNVARAFESPRRRSALLLLPPAPPGPLPPSGLRNCAAKKKLYLR